MESLVCIHHGLLVSKLKNEPVPEFKIPNDCPQYMLIPDGL
jgi:hypothetical protein